MNTEFIHNNSLKKKLWLVGGVTLIGTDTITTKIALDTGFALEMNPVINSIISADNLVELTIIKVIAVLMVFLIWKFYPLKDKKINKIMHFVLPAYVAGVGILITLWNTANIVLIYMVI